MSSVRSSLQLSTIQVLVSASSSPVFLQMFPFHFVYTLHFRFYRGQAYVGIGNHADMSSIASVLTGRELGDLELRMIHGGSYGDVNEAKYSIHCLRVTQQASAEKITWIAGTESCVHLSMTRQYEDISRSKYCSHFQDNP